jgi:hypothetical protein
MVAGRPGFRRIDLIARGNDAAICGFLFSRRCDKDSPPDFDLRCHYLKLET